MPCGTVNLVRLPGRVENIWLLSNIVVKNASCDVQITTEERRCPLTMGPPAEECHRSTRIATSAGRLPISLISLVLTHSLKRPANFDSTGAAMAVNKLLAGWIRLGSCGRQDFAAQLGEPTIRANTVVLIGFGVKYSLPDTSQFLPPCLDFLRDLHCAILGELSLFTPGLSVVLPSNGGPCINFW